MSRPSSWSTVWSNFWRSVSKSSSKVKRYVGQDQFGNRFYEFEQHETASNVMRGYDPGPNPENLPSVEWQSWTKGMRRFPPSDQEIALHQAKQEAQIAQDTGKRAPHLISQGKGAADIDNPKHFPVYEDEIELAPGAEKSKK